MNRVDSEPAFVLHRRAWRETSLLVDLLTRSAGRISAVARAARSPRSAWFGLVEPFRLLQVSWVRRGEMATLAGIELAGQSPTLKGTALWCGFYANELIVSLLPRDDPDSDLFDAYADLLPELSDPGLQASALRRFECRLLEALGVLPDLSGTAAAGVPVDAAGRYRVDPASGPEPAGSDVSGYSGRLLLALAAGRRIERADAADARRLMRTLIEYHLGGGKLKTPSMFRENAS